MPLENVCDLNPNTNLPASEEPENGTTALTRQHRIRDSPRFHPQRRRLCRVFETAAVESRKFPDGVERLFVVDGPNQRTCRMGITTATLLPRKLLGSDNQPLPNDRGRS